MSTNHSSENTLCMIGFTLPEALVDEVMPLLAEHCPYGWQEAESGAEESRTIILYFENPVDVDRLLHALTSRWPDITPVTDSLKNEQWASAWKRFFSPVDIDGQFRIVPPWDNNVPDGLTPLVINPQMAFGTGHHATTSLCLRAVVQLYGEGRLLAGDRFLDAGTGSGILGIACAKLGLQGIGFDLDPLTLENIQENRKLNHIGQEFTAFVGTIEDVPDDEPFTLILANILARPLISLASPLASRLAPGGILILSGLLESQIPDVVTAYAQVGKTNPSITLDGEWACLVFA